MYHLMQIRVYKWQRDESTLVPVANSEMAEIVISLPQGCPLNAVHNRSARNRSP